MAKEKETFPNFRGTIAYSKQPVAGIPLYSDKKPASTLEEMLDELEKADVLSARKDALVAKLKEREASARKQSEPNPKRYTVDPETGQIDIDEENGQYTQRDAMLVSASIKGKSGQYDAAITLINAAKELALSNQPTVAERPKEWLVDPDTGFITRDPESGEYTLSEARTISYSIQKGKQPAQPTQEQKSFLEKLDEVTQGLISQRLTRMFDGDGGGRQTQPPADPVDEFLHRLDQVDKVKERFAPAGGNVQSLAQSGIRGEILKLLLEDERERLKIQQVHEAEMERNRHLGTLAGAVKENLGDGIAAITAAAREAEAPGSNKAPPQQQQTFQCGDCGARFSAPAGWSGQPLRCPNPACGREYTKEELLG